MSPRLLVLLTLLTAAVAGADPRSKSTFAATTTFEACSTSWAFACGKMDAAGNKYGTAHQMTHCERYVFQPDGTFKNGFDTGTYKILKNTVRIVMRNGDGSDNTFELVLSADGATLDRMKRVTR